MYEPENVLDMTLGELLQQCQERGESMMTLAFSADEDAEPVGLVVISVHVDVTSRLLAYISNVMPVHATEEWEGYIGGKK